MNSCFTSNFNPSYIGLRNDILNLIPFNAIKILDVGCSVGTLAEQIKSINIKREVVGIEKDAQMAKFAEKKMDRVIISDIEKIRLSNFFSPNHFDCVIFADVLEHLRDPWAVLVGILDITTADGLIIASVPNVRHYSTIINLLFKGFWPYRERGIHDKTHLRFFTLKNIREMFHNAGLEIISIERKYRIIEKPHRFNKLSRYFTYFFLKEFLTFQYLIKARKSR